MRISTPYRQAPDVAGTFGETVLVAVTHARLGGNRAARRDFWRGVWTLNRRLPEHPGFIGARLRRSLLGREVWTLSVWTGEAPLVEFVRGSAHRDAQRQGQPALISLRSARYWLASRQLPAGWEAADQALALATERRQQGSSPDRAGRSGAANAVAKPKA
jgi:heme-degrading monooxygenase HmoA